MTNGIESRGFAYRSRLHCRVSGKRTPLIDNLLDRVVPLLVCIRADSLEWVRPVNIWAAIPYVDQGSMGVVHSDSSRNGAQVCIGHWTGQHPVQDLLGRLQTQKGRFEAAHLTNVIGAMTLAVAVYSTV